MFFSASNSQTCNIIGLGNLKLGMDKIWNFTLTASNCVNSSGSMVQICLCSSNWTYQMKEHEVVYEYYYRACYGVLRFIMESGAKGCEVVVSGKLRGQRAKSMKFVDGLMIHSGEPTNEYVDTAVRHVHLRQGKYHSVCGLVLCSDVHLSGLNSLMLSIPNVFWA